MIAELVCLALTVYHEARGEPFAGQLAVAQVVLNRVADPAYPDSVCDVVQQGGPAGNAIAASRLCQFSWRCDGKSDLAVNGRAYAVALAIATAAMHGLKLQELATATHYHASYVHPGWAFGMQPVAAIGQHVFYVSEGR